MNLNEALLAGHYSAVDEAKRQGLAAITVVQKYSVHENYRSRQLAVRCAGQIGGDLAAAVIAKGLKDENYNVQVTAAMELTKGGYPAATDAILKGLEVDGDELIRENLALAAGHLDGDRTIKILKRIATHETVLGSNARMALARLKDDESRKSILEELKSQGPRTRYDALEKLIYVNEPELGAHAKAFLADKAEAVRFGIVEMPKFRRVCDQAVDTTVALYRLKLPFMTSLERIYSDEEISLVQKAIK